MNEILNLIKAKRKELKLSQEELAQKIFVAETTYRDIETGKIRLTLENFLKICNALNLNHNQILEKLENDTNTIIINLSDEEIETFKRIIYKLDSSIKLQQQRKSNTITQTITIGDNNNINNSFNN